MISEQTSAKHQIFTVIDRVAKNLIVRKLHWTYPPLYRRTQLETSLSWRSLWSKSENHINLL